MKWLCLLLMHLLFLVTLNTYAQIITTIAGKYNPNPGAGTAIGMNPTKVLPDGSGNLYIVDGDKYVIRKLSTTGQLTTVAGNGIAGYTGDGGPATAASLTTTFDIALDASGNLYILDTHYAVIRKVAPGGIITTVAGRGMQGSSGDGGPALNAWLNSPYAIAVDGNGNIYIAEAGSRTIRKIAANSIITTFAGTGVFGNSGNGGNAASAQFGVPTGVATDAAGNVFVTDGGFNQIRKIGINGIISLVAGNSAGTSGFEGDGGPANSAKLNLFLGSVSVDAAGAILIGDNYNNRVRKVDTNGIINTIVGNGGNAFSGDGGPATTAQVRSPFGPVSDAAGNVYIPSDGRVRKVDANGIITTIAGNGTAGLGGDGGPALDAQFYLPGSFAFDRSGNFFVGDPSDRCIRKISPAGIVTLFAGRGSNFPGDGGLATAAFLSSPSAIATDNAGNIYIADAGASRIRKVDMNGVISTVAGNGTSSYSGDGGPAVAAAIGQPIDMICDNAGNIYFADRTNHVVRRIATDGNISTVAGNGTAGFSGDNGFAIAAQLNYPGGLGIDALGNILISDAYNQRIRRVAVTGVITTIAGNGTAGTTGDGGGAIAASIYYPGKMAIDASGNAYFTDSNRVRVINPSGIIQIVAGAGNSYEEGVQATASALYGASAVITDAAGNLYIAERDNHRIRKVSVSALPLNITEFGASLNNDQVICRWKTAHEVNTVGFNIQRSQDGNNFTKIGIVPSQGDQTNLTNYSFTDYNISNLHAHTLYYRLQVTDKDGKEMYSDVKKVDLSNRLLSLTLSPNPAHVRVLVEGKAIRQLTVSDNTGRTVKLLSVSGDQALIDVSTLKKGIYTVQVTYEDGSKRSEKLAIQ